VVLLEREQFLMELTRLFQKCGSLDSVFITLKKKGAVESFEPSDKCLLRPTDGKKISTMVSSKEVNKLYQAYWNLLRTNMDGLKKREKKVGVKEQKQWIIKPVFIRQKNQNKTTNTTEIQTVVNGIL
uniref:Signal recognition particle 14 kDa protein n=1 Tax=Canis lupus familiaris TaxID=9615 RepID=A0A8C0MZC2_CANLF